jgi:DNA polymerase alpha subunit A
MKKKGLSARVGDTIPYIICLTTDDKSGSDKSVSDRAFHPDEINESNLRIGKIYITFIICIISSYILYKMK